MGKSLGRSNPVHQVHNHQKVFEEVRKQVRNPRRVKRLERLRTVRKIVIP